MLLRAARQVRGAGSVDLLRRVVRRLVSGLEPRPWRDRVDGGLLLGAGVTRLHAGVSICISFELLRICRVPLYLDVQAMRLLLDLLVDAMHLRFHWPNWFDLSGLFEFISDPLGMILRRRNSGDTAEIHTSIYTSFQASIRTSIHAGPCSAWAVAGRRSSR